MLLHLKLKKARELINLTQAQAGTDAGLSQRDISQLETGKKEFIPTHYIQYLNNKGVDITSLFDDNVDIHLKIHQDIHLQPKNQGFSELSQENNNVCASCKEKERVIVALEGRVENLTQTVEDLRQDKDRLLKSLEDKHSSKRNSA